ncbi:MAG: DNA cytosine methyltransferase [Bacillota bacterium]|jgi:DNA (cytosine-5)-methyltransferase 1|nr:DNA cytosine methyltransferase [Bacillota bacterium]NLL26763.1 DNA cytosine methyltransferase [Erysipelotrichia bacterium]
MEKKYKVISLFSGAGGMDIGFINAGFEIVWANDFFKEAVESYKLNIGNHIVFGDITKIKSENIPNGADLVIGGFPCQGFSIANNKRSMKDERNFLYKEMLRIIKDKNPKFFVAENVKGILSMGKGKVFEMIKNDFESIGYKVDARLLNAAEYGIPQARERVIIVGNRLGLENPFPKETHWIDSKKYDDKSTLKKQVTVEEAIGFLSDIPLSKEPINLEDGTIVYNHVASTNVYDKFWGRKYDVNQHEICDYLKKWRSKAGYTTKRIDDHFGYKHTAGHWFRKDNNSGSIPKPSDWWELKKILGFDDKYDDQVTTMIEKEIKFEQSLRITNWDRPSDTITATSPEIHINKERRLSARECAILQTFPMEYRFVGSLNILYRQIGNAVPVKLAEMIAKGIFDELEKKEKEG